MKLGAKELRMSQPTGDDIQKIRRNPITIILDNVLDTYNVGAIFRLADAIAAEKIYLCGDTLTPPNPQIKKASVGTWQWVPWKFASTAVEAIAKVKNEKKHCHNEKKHCHAELVSASIEKNKEIPKPSFANELRPGRRVRNDELTIIAVEQSAKSVPYNKIKYSFPIAFVVGNETYGVSQEVLNLVDQIVEIPMWGVNKSLNVMVSTAIVVYEAMKHAENF